MVNSAMLYVNCPSRIAHGHCPSNRVYETFLFFFFLVYLIFFYFVLDLSKEMCRTRLMDSKRILKFNHIDLEN